MSDKYIEIILGSLEKTNTSAVWSETDALSTVYRGKLPYVADAVQALFLNAYRPGVHMALEGQFSKGCPGDVSGDSVLNREGEAPNAALVQDVFTYLTHVCELMENAPAVHHYVLHFTMNCNSPTEEN